MRRSYIVAGLVSGLLLVRWEGLVQAGPRQAARELEQAMSLKPDPQAGRKLYLTCAVCHGPEGWGRPDGSYPQVAGQIRTVIIKQLADIRARNRDNPIMSPFSRLVVFGGPQQIADVAAYISQLPMTPRNAVGPGVDLETGKLLYKDNCVECHGEQGQGDAEEHIPRIQGQHYPYLLRQFEWIRDGRRRNADPDMVEQIRGFTDRDMRLVLDYVSRLRPPAEKLAQPGWQNPDFPRYVRPEMPPASRF